MLLGLNNTIIPILPVQNRDRKAFFPTMALRKAYPVMLEGTSKRRIG